MRDTAAIGYEELAARAHYPSDTLKEAENGPCLPGLPILAAYVRACEGNVLEWEERWRRLGDETRADPRLPVRPAGASPAAVAGARAGIGVTPPEAYDPERIRAVLRGDNKHSRPAGQQATSAPEGWDGRAAQDGGTTWDTCGRQDSGAGWGGDGRQDSGTGWAGDGPLDAAARRDAGWAWDSSASSGISADRDTGEGWDASTTRNAGGSWDNSARWDARRSWDADGSVGSAAGLGGGAVWESAADRGIGLPNGSHHATCPASGPFEGAVTESRDAAAYRTDRDERAPLADRDERAPVADGYAGDAAERARAVQAEAFSGSRFQDSELTSRPDDGRFSWLEPTSRTRGGKPGDELVGQPGSARAGADLSVAAGSATAGATRTSAERPLAAERPLGAERPLAAVTATAASQPRNRRRDRGFPLRLLAVIILAALIGSALVMVLR